MNHPTPGQIHWKALMFIARLAAAPCECPRPENASGDRECVPCKAAKALARNAR